MNTYKDHIEHLLTSIRALLETHQINAILFGSGEQQCFFQDDHHIPWKMPASLMHFISEDLGPHAVLFITSSKACVYLYQPDDYWYAPPKKPEGEWTEILDYKSFNNLSCLAAALKQDAPRNATWIGPQDSKLLGLYHYNPEAILMALSELRIIKTPYEIDLLQKANQVALRGHEAAKKAFYEGCSELQIHLAYLNAVGVSEEHLPYHNIVAINEHAAILHYQYLENSNNAPQLSFLLDAGFSYKGYAADITRSYSSDNAISTFQHLLQGMRQLKLDLIPFYKIGSHHLEIHKKAHQKIIDLLIDAEILQSISQEAAYQQGLSKIFFPHGIGHPLGLQVHDVGGFQNKTLQKIPHDQEYPSLRALRSLEENMVFTVEPGLYFIPSLLENATQAQKKHFNQSLIQALIPYGGIRDEDNIVIQKTAPLNLSSEK